MCAGDLSHTHAAPRGGGEVGGGCMHVHAQRVGVGANFFRARARTPRTKSREERGVAALHSMQCTTCLVRSPLIVCRVCVWLRACVHVSRGAAGERAAPLCARCARSAASLFFVTSSGIYMYMICANKTLTQ